MSLDCTNPNWLWLLPGGLLWIVWLARSSYVQGEPWRKGVACLLRILIFIFLVLALAGVRWRESIDEMNILFVLDRSDSVSPAQQEFARRWIQQSVDEKKPGDQAGLIVFGGDAGIQSPAKAIPNLNGGDVIVSTERSDIASGLRLASAAFPEHGQRRIVLLSDGNENLGDALNAAGSARALNTDIHVVVLGGEKKIDISIQRLQLPATVKKGQSFEAKVFIWSDAPTSGTLRLFRNEQYLGEQKVQLEQGKNLFTFPQALTESGFFTYDARLESSMDEVPQNNRAFGFTQVRSVPQILMISSDPSADAALAQALKSPDLEITVADVHHFPESLAKLQNYDSIIFSNVSAGDLARDQLELLQSAVRDFGTGFICVGGDQAYAAGGYRGTPLAEILPVEVEISSKKILPPGALMVVIDCSGSMTGEKLDMAKQGAAAAVRALGARDYVGVIAFDDAPRLVVPIQPAGDRNKIIDRIFSISGGGGTSLYPPMKHAYAMLRDNPGSVKHCILLTDGISSAGDFAGITRAMAGDRITVSTVAIGTGADAELLQMIAGIGHGRFYAVLNPQQLPRIFIKETAVVLKSAIREELFTPQVAFSSEPVRGTAPYPELRGYVVTEPKARAETPLLTGRGDPLLAHWQYGLGRVVAFTSDARAKWAQQWLAWNQYQQFWKQIVQWSLRRVENGDFTIHVTTEGGEGRVSVEALDDQNNFRNFLDLQALVFTPAQEKQVTSLEQTGPGHYEGTFPMRQPGIHLMNVREMEHGEVRASQSVGASLNYSPEVATSGPNLHLLRRIAEISGGKVIDPTRIGSNPFFDDRRKSWQARDLWQRLLETAILLFVIDVGVRRIRLDGEAVARAWKGVAAFVTLGSSRSKRSNRSKEGAGEETIVTTLLAKRGGPEAQAQRTEQVFSPDVSALLKQSDIRLGGSPGQSPGVPNEPEPQREIDPSQARSRLLEAKRRAERRASGSKD